MPPAWFRDCRGQSPPGSPDNWVGVGASVETEAELLKRAREMRRNPTEPEKRLWRTLSNDQLGGYKFRRQHVVFEAQAIIDFFCPAIGLAIEVDGDTHDLEKDARRDRRLKQLDFTTMRFSNADVMTNVEGVA